MDRISWHKTDESDELGLCRDHASRKIFYARTYTVGQNYSHSDTNQYIHNLKKSPARPASELRYKNEAIEKFAQEAKPLFDRNAQTQIDLVPMPPSKLTGHPEYDDRIHRVAQRIEELCPNVRCLPLLRGTSNRDAAHVGTATRSVKQIFDTIEIDGAVAPQHRPDARIILLDDIATSGASFVAALRRITDQFPDAKTAVVIWAKAKEVS